MVLEFNFLWIAAHTHVTLNKHFESGGRKLQKDWHTQIVCKNMLKLWFSASSNFVVTSVYIQILVKGYSWFMQLKEIAIVRGEIWIQNFYRTWVMWETPLNTYEIKWKCCKSLLPYRQFFVISQKRWEQFN